MTNAQSSEQTASINKNNYTIEKLEQVRQKISVLRFLDFGETFTEQQSHDREACVFKILTEIHEQLFDSIKSLENQNKI